MLPAALGARRDRYPQHRAVLRTGLRTAAVERNEKHLIGDGLGPQDLVAHGAGGRAEHEAGVDPQPGVRLHAGPQGHGGGGRDETGREVGRAPVAGALLVGERELYQAGFRPGPTEQLHPHRHVVGGETGRHGNRGEARRGAQGAIAPRLRLADGAGRAPDGRIDQRIELPLVEQRGDGGSVLIPLGEARAIVLGVELLHLERAGEPAFRGCRGRAPPRRSPPASARGRSESPPDRRRDGKGTPGR